MPAAHRNGDLRTCGATTSVTGQSTVTVNGKLWAVLGDKDSHCNTCNVPTHNDTDASSGSGDVNAYT